MRGSDRGFFAESKTAKLEESTGSGNMVTREVNMRVSFHVHNLRSLADKPPAAAGLSVDGASSNTHDLATGSGGTGNVIGSSFTDDSTHDQVG